MHIEEREIQISINLSSYHAYHVQPYQWRYSIITWITSYRMHSYPLIHLDPLQHTRIEVNMSTSKQALSLKHLQDMSGLVLTTHWPSSILKQTALH